MPQTIYTFGHSARSIEEFKTTIEKNNIDVLVDLRGRPLSRYYPHFNRENLVKVFGGKYVFGGNELGGSPEFHNDLLEYIKNRGANIENNFHNKLFSYIDDNLREQIFSNEAKFSNDEKRKIWITKHFLSRYIPLSKKGCATDFLREIFLLFPDKKICFFCSEKHPEHCHRYHLLEMDWLKEFNVHVVHLEDIETTNNIQQNLF